jgi:hypothetical protein
MAPATFVPTDSSILCPCQPREPGAAKAIGMNIRQSAQFPHDALPRARRYLDRFDHRVVHRPPTLAFERPGDPSAPQSGGWADSNERPGGAIPATAGLLPDLVAELMLVAAPLVLAMRRSRHKPLTVWRCPPRRFGALQRRPPRAALLDGHLETGRRASR